MGKNCEVVHIITPKKFKLNGLWFGLNNPKRVIVFVHGLSGSAFSSLNILTKLVDENTSVLTFSNRGASKMSKVKKIDRRRKKGSTSFLMGEAHEVFTDCVDDIQGAVNLAKQKGAKEIYLIGHSTGCQKSIYYLSQVKNQKDFKGVVLLCPLSDYADFIKSVEYSKANMLQSIAKKLIKNGKPHELMPLDHWPYIHDAQRFLSLYTSDSEEEIFCYSQENKNPRTFQSVKLPILVVFAEKDEYLDRPISELQEWFKEKSRAIKIDFSIIEGADHGFNDKEQLVREEIFKFINR
ncbi:MAG: alpha/beta fold hydrolase [Patescibacteria group bacterium]